jgi:hypothetical protein
VDRRAIALEGREVRDRRLGDVLEGLLGEEALVRGDEDVREDEQSGERVVRDDVAAVVLEEAQLVLLLVDVEAEGADASVLERLDGGLRVDEPAAAGVDDEDAGLDGASVPRFTRWWVSR